MENFFDKVKETLGDVGESLGDAFEVVKDKVVEGAEFLGEKGEDALDFVKDKMDAQDETPEAPKTPEA